MGLYTGLLGVIKWYTRSSDYGSYDLGLSATLQKLEEMRTLCTACRTYIKIMSHGSLAYGSLQKASLLLIGDLAAEAKKY